MTAHHTTGEASTADLARTYQRSCLARLGHGRLQLIRAYTDVAPALSAVFAS